MTHKILMTGAVCALSTLLTLTTLVGEAMADRGHGSHHCRSTLERDVGADLQAMLDDVIDDAGTIGAVLGVSDGCRTWRISSGVAQPEGHPLRPTARMRIASITKTFVSAVVLQLDAEGVLSLDAPVSTYGDWLPNGDDVTVRHLLNHTSGVFDYIQDTEVLDSIFSGDGRVWSNEELIEIAVAHGPTAEPGEVFSYTNTGYLLIDEVIIATTGASAGELVRARLLDPLRLRATYFASEEPVRGPLSPGWMDLGTGELQDVTYLADLSVAGAAGAITSDTRDLLTWTELLYGGELLDDDQMAELFDTVEVPEVEDTTYGLGVIIYGYDETGPFQGHSGAIWGNNSMAGYLPELGVSIAIITNTYPADVRLVLDRTVETVGDNLVERRPRRRPRRH